MKRICCSVAALIAGGLWAAEGGSIGSTGAEPPALILSEGSVARQELVAVGRDLEVRGHARSDVAVLRGDVSVSGRIDGDVIALGGSVRIDPEGRVAGNAQALGGSVDLAAGAEVGGRIAAYPSLHPSMLTLVDGPVVGVSWWAPALLLLKAGLAAAWLLWATLAALFAPRALRRTATSMSAGPLKLFAIGLGVVLTLVLLIVLVAAVLPPTAALPLVILLALLLLGLKLWGIAALSLELGRFLTRSWRWSMPLILGPVLAGMLALNLLRLVPILGFVAWSAFTLVGVGATVLDRLSPPRGAGG